MMSSRFNEQLHSIRQRLMNERFARKAWEAGHQASEGEPDPYAHLPSAKRVYRKACRAKALDMARDMKRSDLVARFPG